MTASRGDVDDMQDTVVLPVILPFERHTFKASSHPQRVPTIEQFKNNYPQLEPELMELVVEPKPDPENSFTKDGNKMLAELMEVAPTWAREYVGLPDEMIIKAMVQRIQVDFNVALDSRAIYAARGIARDAVRTTLYDGIEVPEARVLGAPLRDDVPSVVRFTSPDGTRYKLLTPEERKDYDIHSVNVDEATLSKEALTKLFTPNETSQGENHG